MRDDADCFSGEWVMDLKLFSKLNPSSIDASFIIRKGDDLAEITSNIKMIADTYGVVGVTISNSLLPVELTLMFNTISVNLVAKGKVQCTADWVQNAALATFLPMLTVSDTNLLTGRKVSYSRPYNVSELTDAQKLKLTSDVNNWGKLKGIL